MRGIEMLYKMALIVCLFSWVAPAPVYPGVPPEAKILGVRNWVAPDHVRFVIDIDKEANFRVEKKEKEVVVVLEKAVLPKELAGLKLMEKPGLKSFRLLVSSGGKVRIELKLSDNLPVNVFKLKKFRDKPDRIVVDIDLPHADDTAGKRIEEAKTDKKEWVVVIDPGHGGDDPGAVGKKGTYEKDVVLNISRKIAEILNKKKGYRAYLTRNGDYYVPFKKRLAKAREKAADLFLSVHADAARNRAAQGSSVYCIAEGAASSEAARILAKNENLADIIGGVPAGEQSDATDPIILNMFQTHVKNQSRIFGRSLLGHMKSLNGLKFDDVQEAPFYVLKLPEITSVLLETAFISNQQEEKLLKKDAFQKEIARAVTDSIIEFLPPLVDGEEEKEVAAPTIIAYTVRGGDTLHSIAASHGTTAKAIKELNKLKRPDLLYVGIKLLIPKKEKQP
jgi:N-acetylmuramoyl-L-alanine amidase